jgi:cysteine-rich repeat protein
VRTRRALRRLGSARVGLTLAAALLAAAPAARAVAPGEIVVADFPAAPQPSGIARFNAAGNPLGPLAGAPEGLVAPRDLAFDAAGDLYVADNGAVLVFDGAGAPAGSITQGITKAMALDFDASGELFVSNRISGGSSEILRFSAAGALLQTWVIPEFDSGGPAPFAREIRFGPDGLLYLALRGSNSSSNDNLIATFDPSTGQFLAFADAGDQVTQPIGLAFEPGGTLLVVNDTGTQSTQSSRIVRLSAAGAFIGEFWNQGAVRDLVFDGFGQLHGANRTGGVYLWGSDGTLRKEYGTASLLAPIALALIPAAGPYCQNEIVEAGEGCDDGNAEPCDGCSALCVLEFGCGDGSACGGEACDDGNALACDGCSPLCEVEGCGDGVLCAALGEECEDANTDPCDGCSPVCRVEACGNGLLDCGEECDDGNPQGCDGCSACRVDELVYLDDFEGGPNGWSANGLWIQDAFRSVSPTHAWYYGQPLFRNYQTFFPGENSGSLTSPPIDLTAISGVELSFSYFLETQNEAGVDVTSVELSRDGFASDVQVLESPLPDRAAFTPRQFDLSPFLGGPIQVRFTFDTVDDVANQFEGFYVDDVAVRAAGAPVCGNGLAAHACGETCDDGNAQDGDGCSSGCQLEGVTDQRSFSGTAAGGSIELVVSGVPLSVPTFAEDSSEVVAAAVAAAINGDPALQSLGVSAAASLSVVFVIDGDIESAESTDPGIEITGPPAVSALQPLATLALALLICVALCLRPRRLPPRNPLRAS